MQVITNSKMYTFGRNDNMPLRSDAFWRLMRGAVKTLTWDEDGNIVTLGVWGPGDVIGQPLSKIEPYQIKCLSSVEASCIPLHQWNWFSDAVRKSIQQTEELLCIIRSERIYHRLLKVLTWLAIKFGSEVEQGKLIDLRLTHQELAEMTGVTRVTVTRMLCQFEQEGIISRPKRHSIIMRSPRESNLARNTA